MALTSSLNPEVVKTALDEAFFNTIPLFSTGEGKNKYTVEMKRDKKYVTVKLLNDYNILDKRVIKIREGFWADLFGLTYKHKVYDAIKTFKTKAYEYEKEEEILNELKK